MPTHAWTGFLHAWHTLGIVLKWMCITVIGIPVAFATCVLVAAAVLAFGLLCLAAVAAALYGLYWFFVLLWKFLTSWPSWIENIRIWRAERMLRGLPFAEVRPRPTFIPLHTPVREIRRPPPAYVANDVSEERAGAATELPGTAECLVCLEEKMAHEFPSRPPTDYCEHASTQCCTMCLEQSIAAAFGGNMWDDIRCPICNIQLDHKDVAEFAPAEVFERYDNLSTRRAIESEIPNFRWCIGPNCSSGQEHADSAAEPMMTCTSCGFEACVQHNVPWHNDMTCEEYEKKNSKGTNKLEKKTEKIIKKIAKRCPGCRRYINKNGGCPHMTCFCGRQFCWNCLHDYPNHSWICVKRR